MKDERHVLDNNVIPSNYQLVLEPNFKTFKFKGKEQITVDIKKPTNRIEINAAELEINSAQVISKGIAQSASVKFDAKMEKAILSFNKPVSGTVVLSIVFIGTNNDGNYGFYRSKYTYNGKEEYMLVSQFEAADARKAFPCFDQPDMKATFDLSFIINKNLDTISNMPIKSSSALGNGKKRVSFKTTLRMSTYLLYLSVGRFEYNRGKYRNIDLRIVTAPGKAGLTGMSMGYLKKLMGFYESYFRIDFPLPKMDLIALPDFSAGSSAMENWGAITFRETELLGNEKITPIGIRQVIAETIAHELAHQWFGDLVTMKWWDDLWLNESFATFMATKAVDMVFPGWEFGLQDSVGNYSVAFGADQFRSTHPINVVVNSPAEVDSIFDMISYWKGASVLEMLEDFAGKETFRKGLGVYLKRHAYSNATKYDLWNAIEEVVRKSGGNTKFSKVARGWIDSTGYPIIRVSKMGNGKIAIEQTRYLLHGTDSKSDVWPIPLHYHTGSKEGMELFGRKRSALKLVDGPYLKLNYGQKGLYRVEYPPEMLNAIGRAIASKKISMLDAWGVENDLFALARSSRIKIGVYLDFVERYCFECDYPLSLSVSGHLSGLSVLFFGRKAQLRKINRILINFNRLLLKRVTWKERKGEKNITTLTRSSAIITLGMAGDDYVIRIANRLFHDYVKSGKIINKNQRTAIYRTVSWNGNESLQRKFIELYNKEKLPDEKRRLLAAIASAGRENLIMKALEFSISKHVRLQYRPLPPALIADNGVGKRLIWAWTRKNWKRFMKAYAVSSHSLGFFVENLGAIDDAATKREIEKFFANKSNIRGDIERQLKQTFEMIDSNIRLLENNR